MTVDKLTTTDTLRAFVVSSDHAEASAVVFARGRSEAKSMALGNEWFLDVNWTSLHCRRVPAGDASAGQFGPGVIECFTADEQRLMRDLGFYQLEGVHQECEECERNVWDMVPESHLNLVNGSYLCFTCNGDEPYEGGDGGPSALSASSAVNQQCGESTTRTDQRGTDDATHTI